MSGRKGEITVAGVFVLEGTITNFRRGKNTASGNQVIVELDSVDSRAKASKLLGRKAVWKTAKGKKIAGKVMREHGGRGAVRVRFPKGLPGQCIGTRIEITADNTGKKQAPKQGFSA